MQENNLVDWITSQALSESALVARGIGDDAAVLNPTAGQTVVTTDLIADGVHFDSKTATASQIGHKAMAVNLSDVAGMAASPIAAFVSLLLPRTASQTFAEELMAGIMKTGAKFGCPIAGGDTNAWDGKLAINVLIMASASDRGPLLRNGAKPGDWLLVTGTLGGSLAGHHLDFRPRVSEALLLHKRYSLSAGMDISDGLAMDARRLCTQSQCGAEIYLDKLPVSDAAASLSRSRDEQISRALGDGEDFELLLAVAPQDGEAILKDQPLDIPLTRIGTCLPGSDLLQRVDGVHSPLPIVGYEHGDC